MIKFGLIGASVLSLLLAAPAMARHVHVVAGAAPVTVVHPRLYYNYDRDLPIQDALRQGFSQGHEYYPSGRGGLYGDGRYPGNTVSNPNYPTWW
jgi:hypothetical protein